MIYNENNKNNEITNNIIILKYENFKKYRINT